MNSFSELLLKKTGIGFLLMILLAFVISLSAAKVTKEAYTYAQPAIQHEAEAFLPITFRNGKIVEPKNVVVSRSFGENEQAYNFVLNTQVDVLDTTELGNGVYLTKSNMYVIEKAKGQTKIQSLSQMPDMVITSESLKEFMNSIDEYVYPLTFIFVLIVLIVFWYIAILLYTLVIYWPFNKSFNSSFAQTFRINQLVYLILTAMSFLFHTNVKIILTLGLMLVVNYCINKAISEKK